MFINLISHVIEIKIKECQMKGSRMFYHYIGVIVESIKLGRIVSGRKEEEKELK